MIALKFRDRNTDLVVSIATQKELSKKSSSQVDPADVRITVSDDNIHIYDSYKIREYRNITTILNHIRYDYYTNPVVKNRSLNSMRNEWIAHNNLWVMNIQRARTAEVDIDYPQKWYYKFAYWFLSIICL